MTSTTPGRLVFSLESTAKGCGWLLDRWAELRSLLEQGQAWRSPDKLKATRLLGRQPVDALYDPQVGMVFLACHQIDPSGGELFHEIWYELKDDQLYVAKKRLNAQPLDWLQPQSEVEARERSSASSIRPWNDWKRSRRRTGNGPRSTLT